MSQSAPRSRSSWKASRAAAGEPSSATTAISPAPRTCRAPAPRISPERKAARQHSLAGARSTSSWRTSSANDTSHPPRPGDAKQRPSQAVGVVLPLRRQAGPPDAHAEAAKPAPVDRHRDAVLGAVSAHQNAVHQVAADVVVDPPDVVGGAVADRLARLLEEVADIHPRNG